MKRTVYFSSPNRQIGHWNTAMNEVTSLRDDWLLKNKPIIGKIDREDLKCTHTNSNNSAIILTIQLTYYPK